MASLGGCNAFLPARDVPPEGELPERFSSLTDAEAERAAARAEENRWWQDFQSSELDALVDEALAENLTLRQLWARLDQAGSRVVQAASGLYPHLGLEGGASYRRAVQTVEDTTPSFRSRLRGAVLEGVNRGLNTALATATGGSGADDRTGSRSPFSGLIDLTPERRPPSRVTTETRQFGLSLGASYELDLWGRIRSQYRAAQLDFVATREDLESVAITLAAEVANRWLRILEQRELQRILLQQLETNHTYLNLVELRFRRGIVSALDVYQQRQAVKEVERQLPLVASQEQVLRHDLAVLLGRAPDADLDVGLYDLATVPEPPVVGLPADLLRYRPDIRAALASLQAADYRVASARADLLPAIRLTGGIGYSASEFSNLFDDWFLSLAADLAQPLFEGFRRRAEVERALAAVEELLANYRLVVLTAIREVEDALVQERMHREHLVALAEQLEAAEISLREASQRYQRGVSDYLPVLTALERTQALARTLVVSRRELLLFRVELYRAIGGTWTEQL